MRGASDPFQHEVDELSDDASIGGEERLEQCACKDVYECFRFHAAHGIPLGFFEAQTPQGSGCGGAWDDDFLEVVVYLDQDGDVMAASHEWNVCSCGPDSYDTHDEWWKGELENTSLYGVYEDGKFSAASHIWSGDLNACIPEEEHASLDRDVHFYLKTRSMMQHAWQEYKCNDLSRFKVLPKDVMRLVILAWYDELSDDNRSILLMYDDTLWRELWDQIMKFE